MGLGEAINVQRVRRVLVRPIEVSRQSTLKNKIEADVTRQIHRRHPHEMHAPAGIIEQHKRRQDLT